MKDEIPPLAASTAVNSTLIKFTLVTRDKGDGPTGFIELVDQNGVPFPGGNIPVAGGMQVRLSNATGGFLAVVFQKNATTNVPGTPLHDGGPDDDLRLITLKPGRHRNYHIKTLPRGVEEWSFSFTAYALTAAGDIAAVDPHIIIRPQSAAVG